MFSYLLPYDTIYNLMLSSVPIYELEPVAEPDACADGAAGEEANRDNSTAAAVAASDSADAQTYQTNTQAKAQASTRPQQQLVYKGLKWVAVPVFTMRENLYYNQWQDLLSDQDAHRAFERKPSAPRPRPQVEQSAGARDTSAASNGSKDD